MAAVLASGGGAPSGQRHNSTCTVLDHWGAALSHRSAAALWSLLPAAEGPVDVSVPGNGGKARRSGIRLHRSITLLPAVVTLRNGIPVTAPARTIADLRSLVASRERRRAIRQAGALGLPLDSEPAGDRTRSELERLFLRLCRRHRLPAPEVNVRVGPHLVDFLWRKAKLAVETDGYRFHRGRAAFEEDRARDLALRGQGYETIRLSYRQVIEEPERVAAVLKGRCGAP
jgi:very-short-patch-repair endonuclease